MAESRSTVRRALLAVAAVAFLVFIGVVQQIMSNGRLVTIDRHTAEHIADNQFLRIMIGRTPLRGWWVEPSRAVTVFGDVRFLVAVALLVACILWILERPRGAVFVAGATLSGVALDLVTRSIIGHVRPAMPSPFSFASKDGMPSGHALDATVCFGAIVIVLFPRLPVVARIAAVIAVSAVVAIVSVSRVTLLTHYISDVVGGVALGVAWLFALAAAFTPWQERPDLAVEA